MERRNLPFFAEISDKVQLIESLRAIPGVALTNYAEVLEQTACLLQRWSGMAPAIVNNTSASRLVMNVRRVYFALTANKDYVLSSAARNVVALHSALVKLNPTLRLGGAAIPPGKVIFILI